jgi:excisionase family DNA binding protein
MDLQKFPGGSQEILKGTLRTFRRRSGYAGRGMRRRRRTEITVETERVMVIRQRRGIGQAWCAACAQYVTMLTAEEVAAVTEVSRRTVYALVEAGRIHFSESPDGALFICLNSLTAVKNEEG